MSKQEVDLLDPQSKGMVAVLCASVAAQKIQRDAAEKGGIG